MSKKREVTLKGLAASPGVAQGPVYLFRQKRRYVPRFPVDNSGRNEEIVRFEQAIRKTRRQITQIRSAIAAKLSDKEAQIFDAHLFVLDD